MRARRTRILAAGLRSALALGVTKTVKRRPETVTMNIYQVNCRRGLALVGHEIQQALALKGQFTAVPSLERSAAQRRLTAYNPPRQRRRPAPFAPVAGM
jgi:hypothetical protein